jgi:hypothetical protein
MTKESVRNDTACHAERSAAQRSIHVLDSSLAFGMTEKSTRNNRKKAFRVIPPCHAERSEASISGFLADARNDTFGFVMLNGAQRSEASTLD